MIRRLLAFPLAAIAALLLFLTSSATPVVAAEGGGLSISDAVPTAAAPPSAQVLTLTPDAVLQSYLVRQQHLQSAVLRADGVHVAIRSRSARLPWALRSTPRQRRGGIHVRQQRLRTAPLMSRAGEQASRMRHPYRVT